MQKDAAVLQVNRGRGLPLNDFQQVALSPEDSGSPGSGTLAAFRDPDARSLSLLFFNPAEP